MANFGNLSISVALAFIIYAVVALFYGAASGRRDVVKSGENAAYATFFFITLSVAALTVLFIRSDFTIEYVANYSNRDLHVLYKIAAVWGGQKGSLLFWSWVLTLFGTLAAWINRGRPGKLVPYALGIICVTSAFFLVLNKFAANPFGEFAVDFGGGRGLQAYSPEDGRGLNPLLQHPVMIIHPPLLYVGYIGFVIPFSFCVAALITREPGSGWITMARRWTLVAWMFLGAGILLGAKWAYVELGWGGYWAWDPVENASLMPWLTGTAFLHSVIVQERKSMLKVWNVVLILTTFMLSIFGTFITRSGMVSSVHAFSRSSIGNYFLVFLVLMGAVTIYLVVTRLDFLKSRDHLDSYASREASFFLNNLILLAACFAVLWGTTYPMISELAGGEQVVLGAPYFNKFMIPIGLFLLLLLGIGPLLAWRKTTLASMKRLFLWPVSVGLAAGAACLAGGIRSVYPLISFTLCAFVAVTVLTEFLRGARSRMRNTGERFLPAIGGLIAANKRRYGGYIVHFGFVLLFVGFSGKAFTTNGWGEVTSGESFSVAGYKFECTSIDEIRDANFVGLKAALSVSRNDKRLYELHPEKRYYLASEQPTSEVRIHSDLKEDVYVVFAGVNEDDDRAVIEVFINPLVAWIWIGSLVMLIGTVVTILPSTREIQNRRRLKEIDRLLRTAESAGGVR